jgi:hypothetical protein
LGFPLNPLANAVPHPARASIRARFPLSLNSDTFTPAGQRFHVILFLNGGTFDGEFSDSVMRTSIGNRAEPNGPSGDRCLRESRRGSCP